MTDILIKTFITFFSIYGFCQIVKDIFFYLSFGKNEIKSTVVVKVCNAEESLESAVRMIVWKCLAFSKGHSIPDILIVDMGSTDSTIEIAKQLCKDYSFVSCTTKEIYEKSRKKE